MTSQQVLNSEASGSETPDMETVLELDISHPVIEDDTPVDNFQSAKQQRLLVESLYGSWSAPAPFTVDAGIGLFYLLKREPIVLDALLSLNIQMSIDWSQKHHRSHQMRFKCG